MGTIKSSRFIDLNIHSLPDYSDSPNRMILEAKRMGYAGICLSSLNPANTFHNPENIYPITDFGIYTGIEIQTDSISDLNKQVNRLREKVDIILIGGGLENINRSAVENQKVDILAHPALHGKPLNHILTKAAADNGVAIDFNIDALIMQIKGLRVNVLSALRLNVRLARKYDAPMILTSNAKSHYDLRGPREMMSLGLLMGMTHEEAFHALSSVPQMVIKRNLDKNRIMKGVEVIENMEVAQ
jgi:ribonuclease P/MRP protein subunit RPP1